MPNFYIINVLFAITETIHSLMLIIFWFSIVRIFIAKYAPYSACYVAGVSIVQSIYNGCPLSDMQNYLSAQIELVLDTNEFWYGIFGEYTYLFRVLMLFPSVFLLYYAYKNWYKPNVVIDFGRIFRKPKLNLNQQIQKVEV